jgi:hypothetical protein
MVDGKEQSEDKDSSFSRSPVKKVWTAGTVKGEIAAVEKLDISDERPKPKPKGR